MKSRTVILSVVLGLGAGLLASSGFANFNDESTLATFGRQYTCSARDENGRRFLASDSDAYAAQDRAYSDCLKRGSGQCWSTGCIINRRGD